MATDSFDFKLNWANDPELSETIVYNGVSIKAIVTREQRSNFTMQGLNNQVNQYQIEIEVSGEDVVNPHAGRSDGDTVIVAPMKSGIASSHRVAEIVRYDHLSNSWVLKLS